MDILEKLPESNENRLRAPLDKAEAEALLNEHNKEPFHLEHAQTVAAVMRWYAFDLGYGEEADFWEQVGFLHDLDYEEYPEEHTIKVQEMLAPYEVPELLRAIVSHSFGMCQNEVEPIHEMEKVLFAADELTGLIGAAILMRPSKSTLDFEVKSLKKKFKDKKFAAGVSRDAIREGAERLGWELDELFDKTIQAMQARERSLSA
ncbi:MAG: hydrolase [Coriobacteriia bacterium]|nr:hydrolase [Coriobacteriia bacterium]